MQVFLVKETEKFNLFKRLFKRVQVLDDKIIINVKCEKIKMNKKIKIVRKIKNIVGENNKIIISKKLKQDKEFCNLLYSCGLGIIEGKKLFKLNIIKFIEFVCKDNNIRCEEAQLGITINDISNINISDIEKLAKKFKTLNIVTNNIKYFKKLEEHLWTENGIIITVTNNKRKALLKANIVLNVDFPEEKINKYFIYDNSIIINLEEDIKIKKKRFCGKILKDYKIKLKKDSNIKFALEKEKYKEFDIKDLAEVYIMKYPNEIDDIIICK